MSSRSITRNSSACSRPGHLDGAWEPEPYPSLLVRAGVAELFLDEADLWPDGQFTTTVLVVNTIFMEAQPELVRASSRPTSMAVETIEDDPTAAKAAAQAGLIEAGAPSLDQAVVDEAWEKLTFTVDPIAPSLAQGAANAYALGLPRPAAARPVGVVPTSTRSTRSWASCRSP